MSSITLDTVTLIFGSKGSAPSLAMEASMGWQGSLLWMTHGLAGQGIYAGTNMETCILDFSLQYVRIRGASC